MEDLSKNTQEEQSEIPEKLNVSNINHSILNRDLSKEINLEEIFWKVFHDNGLPKPTHCLAEITHKAVKEAMREACRQTLELATKNACVDVKKRSQFGKYRKWQNVKEGEEIDLFSYEMQCFVDKNSILDTFNQIK